MSAHRAVVLSLSLVALLGASSIGHCRSFATADSTTTTTTTTSSSSTTTTIVYYENGARKIRHASSLLLPSSAGLPDHLVNSITAIAYFQDLGNVTGWGVLDVELGDGTEINGTAYSKDMQQMHDAGLAEGMTTANRIEETYINTM